MNRRSDVYVFCCSYSHNVAPRDKWVAFVSTTVETGNPEAELASGAPLGQWCTRGSSCLTTESLGCAKTKAMITHKKRVRVGVE